MQECDVAVVAAVGRDAACERERPVRDTTWCDDLWEADGVSAPATAWGEIEPTGGDFDFVRDEREVDGVRGRNAPLGARKASLGQKMYPSGGGTKVHPASTAHGRW